MIRITRQTDYGIVLLSSIAAVGPSETQTAPTLAAENHLPLPMVAKILKLLTRAELLTSQRGVKGGYRLARPADRISVTEMIRALEGPIAMTACVDESSSRCELEGSCPSQGNWQVINQAIRHVLDHLTLADLVARIPGGVRCATCGAGEIAAALSKSSLLAQEPSA